jgi:hypothetical protein
MYRYGLINADVGGMLYLEGVSDSRWNISNLLTLQTIPSTAFEVVKLTPGWSISGPTCVQLGQSATYNVSHYPSYDSNYATWIFGYEDGVIGQNITYAPGHNAVPLTDADGPTGYFTYTPTVAGTHTISTDAGGSDWLPPSNASFTVTVQTGACSAQTSDTTAPSASVSSPATGSTVSGTTSVAVAASDNVGVTKVELYVNGTLQATDTASPYTFSWNTTAVANGSYSLTAKAYDAAGNVGQSAAVTVTVSNPVVNSTPPVVSVTSPANASSVGGTTSVTASASDNVGVSRVDFYLNGALTASVNTSPYGYGWDTTTVANGTYTLSAKAYDAAGNVGQSSPVAVTVSNTAKSQVSIAADMVPPTVSIASPANNSSLTSLKRVTINVNATDNVGVSKTELYLDGRLTSSAPSGSVSYLWSLQKVAAGQHIITAKGYDAAGNVGVTSITVYR